MIGASVRFAKQCTVSVGAVAVSPAGERADARPEDDRVEEAP
jgi:hypothetical protein